MILVSCPDFGRSALGGGEPYFKKPCLQMMLVPLYSTVTPSRINCFPRRHIWNLERTKLSICIIWYVCIYVWCMLVIVLGTFMAFFDRIQHCHLHMHVPTNMCVYVFVSFMLVRLLVCSNQSMQVTRTCVFAGGLIYSFSLFTHH